MRMSGGIECGEFAQSLRSVIDTFKVPVPKSSQTVGEITGVQKLREARRANDGMAQVARSEKK